MRNKSEVLTELRTMLHGVFSAKGQGGSYARLARAHGYVDGYMRALLELEVVSRQELLALVGAERERASGPALQTLAPPADEPGIEGIEDLQVA